MAKGMKVEAKDQSSGITYGACIDWPVHKGNKHSADATPSIELPTAKKQRKTPGPCGSCGNIGHASNNNKKCPNYDLRKKKATTVTPSPNNPLVCASSNGHPHPHQQQQQQLLQQDSFSDSTDFPYLEGSSELDLDLPLRTMYKEELIKAHDDVNSK